MAKINTKLFTNISLLLTVVTVFNFCLVGALHAQEATSKAEQADHFHVEPHSLLDGSVITLITPNEWSKIGKTLSRTLVSTHRELSEQLGSLGAIETYVRIMPEKSFFNLTGAPEWTNALYYKKHIYIPINKSKALDSENLNRSAKHEYVHAVFNAISAGKSPAWLDEGLAQWVEGTENPVLRPALLKFLKNNDPIPLKDLQAGFTRLPSDKVAAAYSQSLVISLMIKQSFGLKKIRTYLEKLSVGKSSKDAFYESFGISEQHFEDLIQSSLSDWALTL